MKTRILLCLLLCSAVFAAGKIQLRYKPEPQSSWSTSGSLTVKNTVTFPDGAQTSSTEQYDLAWQDKVLSRDLTGAVTQQRELQRWSSPGQENVLPGSPIGFQISKFAEQQVASSAGLASSFIPTMSSIETLYCLAIRPSSCPASTMCLVGSPS